MKQLIVGGIGIKPRHLTELVHRPSNTANISSYMAGKLGISPRTLTQSRLISSIRFATDFALTRPNLSSCKKSANRPPGRRLESSPHFFVGGV